MDADIRQASSELLDFIHASPTPYHAVRETASMLDDRGFLELCEADHWDLDEDGRYYVIRAGGSIMAFITGKRPVADEGFLVVGAHTDSPNLRLKPKPALDRHGYRQLGVQIYGGVLLATWTDRDLGLAGRVVTSEDGGPPRTRLLRIDRCVGRVPQLAIHLNRTVNEDGLKLNPELHMSPIIGQSGSGPDFEEWLAATLELERPATILGHDLMFFPIEPPLFAGLEEEFIHAPRLDNLASCHAGLLALIESCDTPVAATRIVALYDHEEVGSHTAHGAAGPFLDDVTTRIAVAQGAGPEDILRSRARSFFVSADLAHGVHPNYADKHDGTHNPKLNGGPVIKSSASARYASDAETAGRFEELCRRADVPVQKFVTRSDMPCGSTIGPMVATRLGIPTVDVGSAMLSMHSAREMAGSHDHFLMIRALRTLFAD